MNDQFAGAVRSASFAMTLSHAQIGWLLARSKNEELADKYEWHEPFGVINFGTPEDTVAGLCNPTVRSLVRRGLVEVHVCDLPCTARDVLQITTAGRLVVALLGEAGFEVDPRHVRPVKLHPDDRHKIDAPSAGRLTFTRVDRDRRDPADAPFLMMGHKLARAGGHDG